MALNDSIESIQQTDTLLQTTEPVYGLLLTPPEEIEPAPQRPEGNTGVSFILSGLFLILLVIALRYRNNVKYVVTMVRNLVETRTRQNVFDDTVRETSLIVLLNILLFGSAGIVMWVVYQFYNPESVATVSKPVGMLIAMALAAVYSLFMWMSYICVGWVFSDRSHAMLWVRGYAAGQALIAPIIFLTALVGLCRPETSLEVGIVSAAVFILAKLAFIWKGYRIFFNQFSSWVLFLCYLCSLEIVPLILCYRIALLLGGAF